MKIFRKEHFGGVLYDTNTLKFELLTKKNVNNFISKHIAKELPERKDILSAPIRVYFELLRKCNICCKHCFVNSSINGDYGESTEFVFDVIDELSDIGVIDLRLTGGEPTLRKDIFKILRYAKNKGLVISLNTNGIFQNKRELVNNIAELNLEQVTVSIDGMKKNHEYMRGENTFAKTINSLELMHDRGINLRINTVITKRNYLDLPQVIDLAGKYCKEINFFFMRPVGRATKLNHLSLDFFEHYMSARTAMKLRNKYPHLNIMHFEQSFTERSINYHCHTLKEGYPYGNTTINLDCHGNIWPHGYNAFQDARLNLGNLKKTSLLYVWHKSKKLDKLRDWYTKLIDRCSNCEMYLKECAGYNFEMLFAQLAGEIPKNPFCISKSDIPTLEL